ncbi:putative lipid II flippase MurJ [Clostridioides difficile]|uniref:murein biosynthesis integral membrane protein MurJ n=1 Tax=Clostridioides sp. ZZV14-6153 TaxID=2811494 RepID=UPI001D113EC6|nr:murein biosynthesis integral membrane protein MurJ [Clostridioides sp. ZZV14-6153]WLD27786.1 putative lipid II flippase MurJ [Clostridioides difficile]
MSKVAKATFYLMIVTVISKILGMGRELVLSSIYGTGLYTESYLTAMNIPNIIFAAIGTAIVTTFIPMYQDISSKQGEKQAVKFLNNVLNIIVGICIIVAILGVIFSKQLVSIFAIGFEGERFELTVKFTKVLITGIIFIGITSVMSAFLQIKENFIIVGFGSIPYNIVIIISIMISTVFGPYVLPVGAVVAMIVQLLFYLFFVKKTDYKYSFYLDFKDDSLIKLLALLSPVFIGVAVNQVNSLVDTTLASTLVKGSIPALTYADRLNGFVTGTFTASIVSVMYPMLSKLSAENNQKKFTSSVKSSVNMIIISMIPISVGSIVFANPVVRIIFERGAFDARATQMTATALVFYAVGMTAFGLRDILGKVFYSLQDTKTPMVNGIISVCVNIVLDLILIKPMVHGGLALATSSSSIACILLLFLNLRRKVGYFGQDKIIKATLKSLVASVIMGILSYFTYKFIFGLLGVGRLNELVSLTISVIVGGGIYTLLMTIFKVEEVDMILNIAKRKLHLKN